ncbi:MAG: NAD(P)-dependent oxidoreductase [Chamaesiphon sp.]
MSEVIGLIGLGNMGLPLALNLIESGYRLRVYNRTPEKAKPLADKGAEIVNRPADVVEPGGLVFTILANDSALEAVTLGENGISSKLGSGGIHISMSTIAPTTAHFLAAAHSQQGATYLAAPVFGRPEAVAARKLWICLSGKAEAKNRVRPILDQISQGIYDFGEEVKAANVVKLAGNFLIISAIEAMAEAFTLAQKNGIDRTQVADLFGQTLFACPIYQNYGQIVAREQYEPAGFKLSLGLKDVTLALSTARDSQMPLPLASLIHDRLMSAVAKGRGDIDWTGLALSISEDAGLKPNPKS